MPFDPAKARLMIVIKDRDSGLSAILWTHEGVRHLSCNAALSDPQELLNAAAQLLGATGIGPATFEKKPSRFIVVEGGDQP